MLIAQISDMHVMLPNERMSGYVNTSDALARCITTLNQFVPKPDVVVASGDLVNDGTNEQYQHLKTLIDCLEIPLYLMNGNHDDRSNLKKVFADHKYLTQHKDLIQYTIDDHPVRLIALDSQVPGEMRGELHDDSIAWLNDTLKQAPQKPTLIFIHHPPFRCAINAMDTIRCNNADKLAEVISKNPQVLRVL